MKTQDTENVLDLLPLCNDFVFKLFCRNKPHLLGKLLDAILDLQGSQQIKELKLLNPEIPEEDIQDESLAAIGIEAHNHRQECFTVDIQAFPSNCFDKRALYHWSMSYIAQMESRGSHYPWQPVHSLSLLNYKVFQTTDYHTTFQIQERDRPHIILCKEISFHTIELPNFNKEIGELESELETWMYFLQEAENLQETSIAELKTKNQDIEEASEALKEISIDKKIRKLYNIRSEAEN